MVKRVVVERIVLIDHILL